MDRPRPEPADLLVRNAYLVTVDTDRRILTNGAVAITGGRVIDVGRDVELSDHYEAKRIIDAAGAIVHPGFIDTHIHLLYHLLRWSTNDGGDWNTSLPIHAEYATLVDEEAEYLAAKLSAWEMARNGTTCFLEAGNLPIHDGAAAEAIEEVGIRGLIGKGIKDIDPSTDDSDSHRAGQHRSSETERAIKGLGSDLWRNSDSDALVRGVVNLSGMGSASDELELAAKAIADEHGVILNQHLSYHQQDVDMDDRRLGKHAIVHFAEIGLLAGNCTFSHVNFVRDDEVEPFLSSGASIGWCPMASMLFGIGGTIRGKHLELYRKGANISLGCDSANWTSAFDIGEQAFMASLTAREKTGKTDALLAEDMVQMATMNGARSCGMADEIGSIEVGKRADLVIRRNDLPESVPSLDPLRSVMYSSRAKSVVTVVVNGEVIVAAGHSTKIDEIDLKVRANEKVQDLFQKMGRPMPSGHWPRID